MFSKFLTLFKKKIKPEPVAIIDNDSATYIPFDKLNKFDQIKILGQVDVTKKSIQAAINRHNLPQAKIQLFDGLKRGFILDITDYVHKNNKMPDPEKMLNNYATIPGFIETFRSAGITRTEMLCMLIQLTGADRSYA
jgi:hypothetical protein